MEVPTILYFLKQKVDIPVPGGGGRLAGLQGFFHPELSSTAPEVFKVFAQDNYSSASSSSSHSPAGIHEDADELGEGGFFALFPILKKSARVTGHSSARVPLAVELIHAEFSSNCLVR